MPLVVRHESRPGRADERKGRARRVLWWLDGDGRLRRSQSGKGGKRQNGYTATKTRRMWRKQRVGSHGRVLCIRRRFWQ